MLIEILIVIIIILVFFILYYKEKREKLENFLGLSMLNDKVNSVDYNNMNIIYSHPELIYSKLQRNINDIFIEDDSNILENKRENKVLRDVNELMNYKPNLDNNDLNIYNLNDANSKNKMYTKNLSFFSLFKI